MKTIARIVLIALLSLMIMDASAQNLGIKFGSVWSNASLEYDGDSDLPDQQFLISPKLGVIFETSLYEGLFLQTGLMVSLNGYRYDSQRTYEDDSTSITASSKERPILLYLSLPVNFGYKHNISDEVGIFGIIGPQFRYLTYNTHTYKVNGEWDNESSDIEVDGEEKSIYKNFDFALNIEAGVQYDRFKFSLYYMPSFTNIFNDEVLPEGSSAQWKNYSFGVNVAVLFGNIK